MEFNPNSQPKEADAALVVASIGANTAIFSIVNALMLKSLRYADPDRIGMIFWRIDGSNPFDGLSDIDGEQWELLRNNVPSVIGAVSSPISSGANLQVGRGVQYVRAGRVSAHYFDVLGVHPVIGRTFTENEDRPQGPQAVILSYGLWRTTFHADPRLIGQAIDLKGEPYTVVGVVAADTRTPLNAYFLAGGIDPHECALWHAARACTETNRSSIVHGNPHHRRRGALRCAPGVDRWRSRSDGRPACRQQLAHPFVDPSTEPPARLQSARRDDCQGLAG